MSARDRNAEGMRIREDRRDILLARAAILIGKWFERFIDVPAMIFAFANNTHFFKSFLAHVADPEITRHGIKAESPRLAQTDGPCFRHDRWIVLVRLEEWIVTGDCVRFCGWRSRRIGIPPTDINCGRRRRAAPTSD